MSSIEDQFRNFKPPIKKDIEKNPKKHLLYPMTHPLSPHYGRDDTLLTPDIELWLSKRMNKKLALIGRTELFHIPSKEGTLPVGAGVSKRRSPLGIPTTPVGWNPTTHVGFKGQSPLNDIETVKPLPYPQ